MDVAKVLAHEFVQNWAAWNMKAMLGFQKSYPVGGQMAHVSDFQISVIIERDISVRQE
jgi:hypothetical protein